MARSTWWQQCCTAAFDACSCTSVGRSGGCSSSPWCRPPASPVSGYSMTLHFHYRKGNKWSANVYHETSAMCFPFGLWKRGRLEKVTCSWGTFLKEDKMRSLLPCFPEDPSTPHCSRPTSPRAAWSPPSARRPPRSTCRAECRCTPQPPASSRGDTRTRCIFRPIILSAC